MKDLTRDASVMGLYECMPVIKKNCDKYKCRSHQRKIYDLRYNIRKQVVLRQDLILKKIHLILASNMRARGLQDEVVRVR